MRNVYLSAAMILYASLASAQVSVGTNSRLLIDQSTVDVQTSGITRMEMQVDLTPYASIGLNPFVDPSTPAGNTTYMTPIGALSNGLHTIRVRACNDFGCGVPSADLSVRKVSTPGQPTIRVGSLVVSGNIIARYPFLDMDVIDVSLNEYPGSILRIGSPTFTVPGYNAQNGDKITLELEKK